MIEAIFGVFGIAALLLFRFLAPASAVAVTCFTGWLLLPVGNFPAGSAEAVFPYWITGAAVPSDMLLTKMWWPPVVALAGALWMDRETLARWRPGWMDVPMALWCLWPIGQWPFVDNPAPQPWVASLYLAAAWGAAWVLGRIYFCGHEGGRRLIEAMVAGLVVITPIALIEGILGPRFYGWLYELHPFRSDGQQRYVGFRPLGFSEHGNQYGIWVAATALAAIWLWQNTPKSRLRSCLAAVAALALMIALISQSVGAILLLCAGIAVMWTIGRQVTRRLLLMFLMLMTLGGMVYLSGLVPLQAIAQKTVIGQKIVGVVRSSGRESFTWRLARDQRALTLIGAHPIVGAARWDWWRQNGERPWDLALLIVGQFGVIGLVLAFGSLLTPVLCAFALQRTFYAWRLDPTAPLIVIVLIAIVDALLNSFFFYPAIVAAGGLCARSEQSS
jgi:hypothetical protein